MTLSKINFHMHSTGSDGQLAPNQVVEEAMGHGVNFICFTDHYLYPEGDFFKGWREGFFSKEYIEEVKGLQKAYKGKIDISFGVEMDWLPTHLDWIKKEIEKHKFDYVIGSIHNLYAKGEYFFLFYGENWRQDWLDSASKVGGIRKFVEQYYSQLRKMSKSGLFDCVGHLDLIKMYNLNNLFFSEQEAWYKKAVSKTLDVIKKADLAIEINTRGIKKIIAEQFPSLWILKEAKKRQIPVTVGTDSHRLGEASEGLEEAYHLAKQAGYTEIVRFKARKRIVISL